MLLLLLLLYDLSFIIYDFQQTCEIVPVTRIFPVSICFSVIQNTNYTLPSCPSVMLSM